MPNISSYRRAVRGRPFHVPAQRHLSTVTLSEGSYVFSLFSGLPWTRDSQHGNIPELVVTPGEMVGQIVMRKPRDPNDLTMATPWESWRSGIPREFLSPFVSPDYPAPWYAGQLTFGLGDTCDPWGESPIGSSGDVGTLHGGFLRDCGGEPYREAGQFDESQCDPDSGRFCYRRRIFRGRRRWTDHGRYHAT